MTAQAEWILSFAYAGASEQSGTRRIRSKERLAWRSSLPNDFYSNSRDSANTQNRRNQAKQTKDHLEDAMYDLNRSTNLLRRKLDPTSNYLETKVQIEQVMVNSELARLLDVMGIKL